MDIEGFELTKNEQITFHRSFEEISRKYAAPVTDCDQIIDLCELISELRSFDCMRNFIEIKIINVFNISNGSKAAKVINFCGSYGQHEEKRVIEYDDIFSIGLIEKHLNGLSASISLNTFIDKFSNFFTRKAIDVNNRSGFSSEYLTISNQPAIIKTFLSEIVQSLLLRNKNCFIQIKNDKIVLSTPYKMSIRNSKILSQLLMAF